MDENIRHVCGNTEVVIRVIYELPLQTSYRPRIRRSVNLKRGLRRRVQHAKVRAGRIGGEPARPCRRRDASKLTHELIETASGLSPSRQIAEKFRVFLRQLPPRCLKGAELTGLILNEVVHERGGRRLLPTRSRIEGSRRLRQTQ